MKDNYLVVKPDGTLINQIILKKHKPWTSNDLILFLMALLSVVFLAIFAYAPLYGLVLAFKKGDGYLNISVAIANAPFNGLDNFKEFISDPDFKNIMFNTIGLNLLQLLINFPAPIIFAILLSELIGDRFKKIVQTVTFFPHFISWVIFGGIFITLLDFDTGFVNGFLVAIGIVPKPIDILGGEEYFWGLIIITSILKGLGWGSVIYIAAISGIPNDLYEAAKMDGANRWHKIRYITIPSIMPTVTLFFILSIAGILNNGIEHLWVFQNANNIMRSEVLDTFIYKYGIPKWRYSYATAIGLLKSVVSLLLLIAGNTIVKKLTGNGIY
ncbi:MAG: ABC transporter permease subunit [Bacillales bacterium]|jgi:putative aldouronate transport system permease protein|nr:ABC transporter permease subunit [Bacillales bacterium]